MFNNAGNYYLGDRLVIITKFLFFEITMKKLLFLFLHWRRCFGGPLELRWRTEGTGLSGIHVFTIQFSVCPVSDVSEHPCPFLQYVLLILLNIWLQDFLTCFCVLVGTIWHPNRERDFLFFPRFSLQSNSQPHSTPTFVHGNQLMHLYTLEKHQTQPEFNSQFRLCLEIPLLSKCEWLSHYLKPGISDTKDYHFLS